MTLKPVAKFDRLATLWAAILVISCAMMTIGILPLVLGLYADAFSLSLEQTGILATVGQTGFGVGSLLVVRLRRLRYWRLMLSAAAILAAVLNGLAMLAHDYLQICSLQFAFGVASGAVTGLALYVVGRTPRPERAFGLLYAFELAAFSVFAAAFPMLRRAGGFPVALNSLGALLLIAAVIVWALPDRDRQDDNSDHGAAGRTPVSAAGTIALVALTVFETGIFALWAYAERIGTLAGIAPQDIGIAIALTGLAGMAGAGTATVVGARAGRRLPVIIATLAVLAGNILLFNPPTFAVFAIATCIFNFGWLLALPYYMGAVVAADTGGALTSLLALAQAAGMVAGPLIVAFVVGDASTRPVVVVSCVACLAGAALILTTSGGRPESPRTANAA